MGDKNRNEDKGRKRLPFLRNFPDPLSGRKKQLRQSRSLISFPLREVRVTFLLITVYQFIIISTSMVKCDSFTAT